MDFKLKLLSVNSWGSWRQLPGASSRKKVHLFEVHQPSYKSEVRKSSSQEIGSNEVQHFPQNLKKLEVGKLASIVRPDAIIKGGAVSLLESTFPGAVNMSFILDGGRLFVSDCFDGGAHGKGFLKNIVRGLADHNSSVEHFHLNWPPFDCFGLPLQDESSCITSLRKLILTYTKDEALSLIVTFGSSITKLFDLLIESGALHKSGRRVPDRVDLPSIDNVVLSDVKKKAVWDALKFVRPKGNVSG